MKTVSAISESGLWRASEYTLEGIDTRPDSALSSLQKDFRKVVRNLRLDTEQPAVPHKIVAGGEGKHGSPVTTG